jgi:hypothetical protein
MTKTAEKTGSRSNTSDVRDCFTIRGGFMSIIKILSGNPLVAVITGCGGKTSNADASEEICMEAKKRLKNNIVKAGWTLVDISLVMLAIYVFFF